MTPGRRKQPAESDTSSTSNWTCSKSIQSTGNTGSNAKPPNSDSSLSDTVSLPSAAFDFVSENGRTYHRFRAGSYIFPNDPTEQDRLDMQYEIHKLCFENRCYIAPISNPRHILDIGTGTGIWCVEMADLFPSTEVIGMDLSPIQPTTVPPNVHFIVDDCEEEDWLFSPDHFSYIHTSMMLGSLRDFRHVVKQALKYLQPGGWFESLELELSVSYEDGAPPPNHVYSEWIGFMDEAQRASNRPMNIASHLKRWYEEAGFVDVHEEIRMVPLNAWPTDPRLNAVGKCSMLNLVDGVQAFCMAPFTRYLGWSKEQVEVYLVEVRKSLQDQSVHAYHKLYTVYGRKPYPNERRQMAPPPQGPIHSQQRPPPQFRPPPPRDQHLPSIRQALQQNEEQYPLPPPQQRQQNPPPHQQPPRRG
ncbi:MAG: hypothetical protein M1834_008351 [Cirrosporium novae-zelandiae]|nr:MAG: hypothetical protein M1834_008351 [Cirrosporium novae-zelandiae]